MNIFCNVSWNKINPILTVYEGITGESW